jgi:para-aminobenzoate synthetase component 2
MAKVLVVDNYDSFVYTIADYLVQLGSTCDVRRND